uniref:(California timema) hypothetical protein n=1 Tax=Timema californicum TaxID=61474 RepID=A0A7R9PBS9_TIMCA|nr:unnamed protein product [Timema californicum]
MADLLLYHDPSLGRQVNFVLKRVEILHADPTSLQRPHDIDRFLSSFCTWQHGEDPPGDSDPLHWDHALILTGLDLYVVSKNGKVSSQVVGLAPVAGMCTDTSSCTVNEGRHFESVYVVAHEIGHNLGMRHDGPLAENECDPSSFIMSPTLGSGKITWSSCSRRYLENFLEVDINGPTSQKDLATRLTPMRPVVHACLNSFALPALYVGTLNTWLQKTRRNEVVIKHILVVHSDRQHVRRFRQWCRSGRCVGRGLSALQAGFSPDQRVDGLWSDWTAFSDCASGCLLSDAGLVQGGSSGIMVSTRRCNNPRYVRERPPLWGCIDRIQAARDPGTSNRNTGSFQGRERPPLRGCTDRLQAARDHEYDDP